MLCRQSSTMNLQQLEIEAQEAWRKIVAHEMDNVEFWGQVAHDEKYRAMFDDYRIKRNRVIKMRRKKKEDDGMDVRTLLFLLAVIIIYLIYHS